MVRKMSETSGWRCGRSVDNPPNYPCCKWLARPEAVSRVPTVPPMPVPVTTTARFGVVQPIHCCCTFTHILFRSVRFQIKSEVVFCMCESHGSPIFVSSECSVPMLKLHRLWVELHVGTVPWADMCCASTQLLGASRLVRLSKRKPGMHWLGGVLTQCPRSAQLEEFGSVGGSSRS